MGEEVKAEEQKVHLSEEDIKGINADIDAVKEKLVSKDTQDLITKTKEEAKAEAFKEVEVQKKIEEMEKEKEELVKSNSEKEKQTAEELAKLKTKVDELTTSKQTIAAEDPFKTQPEMSKQVDAWSDEKVKEFEEASAAAMFGKDWDNRI